MSYPIHYCMHKTHHFYGELLVVEEVSEHGSVSTATQLSWSLDGWDGEHRTLDQHSPSTL